MLDSDRLVDVVTRVDSSDVRVEMGHSHSDVVTTDTILGKDIIHSSGTIVGDNITW